MDGKNDQNVFSDKGMKELIYRLDGPLRWATKENLEIVRKADIQPGWRVLDVGGGTGYISIPLAMAVRPNGCVYSVDQVAQLQEVIKQKAKKMGLENQIKLVPSEVSSLPFPDNHFDAVLSSYLFHELPDSAPKVLKELYRVLKPGKKVVIADFRRIEDAERREEIEKWYRKQNVEGIEDDEDIHLRFSLKDLEAMLLAAGFHHIEVSTWLEFHMHGEAVK